MPNHPGIDNTDTIDNISGTLRALCTTGKQRSDMLYLFTSAEGSTYRLLAADYNLLAAAADTTNTVTIKKGFVMSQRAVAGDAVANHALGGYEWLLLPESEGVAPRQTITEKISGELSVLTIMVHYRNQPPPPYGPAHMHRLLFGNGKGFGIYPHLEQASFGTTRFTGDVIGWYATYLPQPANCDNLLFLDTLLAEAKRLANHAGYRPALYDRIMVIAPPPAARRGAPVCHPQIAR